MPFAGEAAAQPLGLGARRFLLVLTALAARLPFAGAGAGDGNCGVEVPFLPRALRNREAYESLGSRLGVGHDLEDELWSMGEGDREARANYKTLKKACTGKAKHCNTFGVHQWNLSRHAVTVTESVRGRLCEEDMDVWQRLGLTRIRPCTVEAPCKRIDSEVRLVGLQVKLTPEIVEVLHGLPFLFTIQVTEFAQEADFSASALPPGVRVVTVLPRSTRDIEQVAPLLRNSRGVQSLHVYGNQALERWLKLDLSIFCGMDLLRFNGFVMNAGEIPECWSAMRNLEAFYCTNCMLTTPPSALRGLTSLRSFIAFRQSEMTPCVAKSIARSLEACKPSWETKCLLKDSRRQDSTGDPSDFQEGPSYMCPEVAYGFKFEEFLKLGWTNVEKVWLDGNFLKGGIPENIADLWPKLKSLDLYDNDMEGPIPASLARLDFVKLQLNGNNFSGTIPTGVVNMLHKNHMVLGLASNPHLEGCAPRGHDEVADTRLHACHEEEL